MTPEPEITLREAAERTRVVVDTVRGWVKSGRLPATQVGPKRLYRIKVADLDKFLDRR